MDAGEGGGEGGDGALCAPVVGPVLGAVDEVGSVVAGAVCAAVAVGFGLVEVAADLLRGGPEVVDGAGLVGEDGAVGDQDAVGADALAGVGEVQAVVEGGWGVGVLETVEVPVGVRGHHDGRLALGGGGGHAHVPFVGGHGVGGVSDDLAGETLLAVLVDEGESDGTGGVSNYGPVAPVPGEMLVMAVGLWLVEWYAYHPLGPP